MQKTKTTKSNKKPLIDKVETIPEPKQIKNPNKCETCGHIKRIKTIKTEENQQQKLTCKVCGLEYVLKDTKKHKLSDRHVNIQRIIENLLELPDNLLSNLKSVCDKKGAKGDDSINKTLSE